MDKGPPDKREPDKKTKDISETKSEAKKPVKQQGRGKVGYIRTKR